MFHADITFVLALIALVAGAFLVLSAKAQKEIPTGPCIVIGYLVAILAIIMLLFSSYGMTKSYIMKRQIITSIMQQGRMMPMMQQMQPSAQQPMMQHMQQPQPNTPS